MPASKYVPSRSNRQENKTYKLTYTNKFGVYPYVFKVLEFNGIN
jgi:hypothetical protein